MDRVGVEATTSLSLKAALIIAIPMHNVLGGRSWNCSLALFWFPFFLDEKMSRGILVELSIVVRG